MGSSGAKAAVIQVTTSEARKTSTLNWISLSDPYVRRSVALLKQLLRGFQHAGASDGDM